MQYLLMYAQHTNIHVYVPGGEDMVANSANKMYPVIGKMVLCNTRT